MHIRIEDHKMLPMTETHTAHRSSAAASPSGAGGLALLYAFVGSTLTMVGAITLDALDPSTVGAALLVGLTLVTMGGLITLIMRLLADELEPPRIPARLARTPVRDASKVPASRPSPALMERRTFG
jgi:hypothetical protein